MFKELIEVWKGKQTLLDEVVADFTEMIKGGHIMFDRVTNALFEGQEMENLKTDVYKKDSRLNDLERTIRRKIMTLLSGGTEEPIAACLILMSISKDAERLGDYAKNILEVFETKPKLGKDGPYYDRLVQIKNKVLSLFDEVLQAYKTTDKEKARQIVEEAYEHQKLCDQNVRELLLAKPEENSVAYALLCRFFKRSLAHLSNIATSVFMPVTKIDFFDEIR